MATKKKTEEKLFIKKISFHNIMAFDDLEVSPGKVNVIQARNGVGKTSFVEGMMSVLQGAPREGKLIREGKEEGQAVIILTDDTEIVRNVDANGKTSLTVTPGSVGVPIKSPQTYLDGLLDELVNPLDFFQANKKERIEWLLKACPMELTAEQTKRLNDMGLYYNGKPSLLEWLELRREEIYDERAKINKDLNNSQGTLNNLRASVITLQDAEQVVHEYREKKALREEKEAEYRVAQGSLSNDLDTVRNAAKLAWQTRNDEAKATYEAALEVSRNEYNADMKVCQDKYNADIEALRVEYDPIFNELQQSISTLTVAMENEEKARIQRDIIVKTETELADFQVQSDTKTDNIKIIDVIKNQLVETIPIKGLRIDKGEIYYKNDKGVELPWVNVNKQRQIEIIYDVAVLRSGKLGIVKIDGIEELDDDNFELFKKAAQRKPSQLFCTRAIKGVKRLEVISEGEV